MPLALRSTFHIKVHSACLEHLAPTDGTPGIGNGCQIKLAIKAAGEVNWRLGIQVDIGCRTPSSVPKSRCFRDLKLCWAAYLFPFGRLKWEWPIKKRPLGLDRSANWILESGLSQLRGRRGQSIVRYVVSYMFFFQPLMI